MAKESRVHVRSVQGRKAAWTAALFASKGSPDYLQLFDEQFAVLEAELQRGPVAHGSTDQTWALSTIKTVIGRRFHKCYTVVGVGFLLRRHGQSYQMLARRAMKREKAAIVRWVKEARPSTGRQS